MTAIQRPCPFCGHGLPMVALDRSNPKGRLAYDPWKGRLWAICASCRRWSQVPLALRWEILEQAEELVRTRGKIRLSSEHLSLIQVPGQELVRVGGPPRIEFATWRYGRKLPGQKTGGFLRSVFAGLPPPPVDGYRPYALGRADPPAHWVVSPFQNSAWALTTVFTAVPFAPECPSCGGPMALHPWSFHSIRIVLSGRPGIAAECALCSSEVFVDIETGRPALRLGLSVVDGPSFRTERARDSALRLDAAGGSNALIDTWAREDVALGELDGGDRATLAMALDEQAELDALEREWREEEEIAVIMDGELSAVPGFDDFRKAVLEEQGEGEL